MNYIHYLQKRNNEFILIITSLNFGGVKKLENIENFESIEKYKVRKYLKILVLSVLLHLLKIHN